VNQPSDLAAQFATAQPAAVLVALRAAFISMVSEKELDDLSMRQLAMLLILRRATTGVTVRQLSADLNVFKANISQNMDRLALFGLAQRKPDPADKRSVLLEITDQGAALVDRMTAAMGEAASAQAEP
jgi:DNA-binding MarR family transcriptional regulator